LSSFPGSHKHDKAENPFTSHSKEVEFSSHASVEETVVIQFPTHGACIKELVHNITWVLKEGKGIYIAIRHVTFTMVDSEFLKKAE